MSAEFWAIIGVGVGITTIVSALFTLLNMRISDLRKDVRDMGEEIVRSESRVSDKIDAVEERLREDLRQTEAKIDGVEARLEAKIDGVEARLEAKIDGVETGLGARIDGVDARLRVVEQGQARVIGAVDMLQTIVVATLRGEEVGAD